MELIRIEGLNVVFSTRTEEIRAVDSVDLTLNKGDTLGLIGESGCGKTVMGMAVTGLLPENARVKGSVWYTTRDILKESPKALQQIRGKEIAMIAQNSGNALNPVLTIGRQVAEPLLIHHLMPEKEAHREVVRLLGELGFENPEPAAGKYPHEFSGGMRERILIAIAVISRPEIIIADEPTAGLDAQVRAQVLNLLKKQVADQRTLFLITHDLGTAGFLCKRLCVMYAGEIVESGPTKDVLSLPLHPYTQGLLASLPSAGLHPIPGTSPSPARLPDGCRFYDRCPAAMERCRTTHPEMKSSGNTRQVRCLRYA